MIWRGECATTCCKQSAYNIPFPGSVDSRRRSDERENYESFLPAALFPVSLVGVNGETAGALFFLFLSAFDFFFSRLLLN
ncbi:MAG: hypothetical protein WA728_12560 [Xanthobacteraceae bacterium]